MSNKLVVLIPDRLSVLVNKGEVIPRYYNPGNVFDEVHIMMTNDDKPDITAVQTMVGDAKLYLHNLVPPERFFKKTLGWQFPLMKTWVQEITTKIAALKPAMVRTHNNFMEGYLAYSLNKEYQIPYVTSLHGIWDIDELGTWKQRVHRFFRKKLERATLTHASAILCVYSPIIDYAVRHGGKHVHLMPNFVGADYICKKQNWELHSAIKIMTVNRQQKEKNPENIIRALKLIPYPIQYTLVGDGIYHDKLQSLVSELGLQEQVTFIKALPNAAVCKMYSEHDFMVSNCHYRGISKTIIEAGLSGLPIILNHYNDGFALQEYEGDWIHSCIDTPEGYAKALIELIENKGMRERLANNAIQVTSERFLPQAIETQVANIYRQVML